MYDWNLFDEFSSEFSCTDLALESAVAFSSEHLVSLKQLFCVGHFFCSKVLKFAC